MLTSPRTWLSALLVFTFALLAQSAPVQTGPLAPLAAPTQDKQGGKDYDIWQNEHATQKGREMFAAVLETAGGLEAWNKIEGLRFDLLKIQRVLVNLETGERKVHHVIPRLCWFDRQGDGFTISEYIDGKSFKPLYRRDISFGKFAWAESNGQASRKPQQAATSRTLIQRRAFLSMMPFSLHERGAEWIFLKDLVGDQALYGVRLGRPLIMEEKDEIADYLVVVDTKTKVIKQLQYSLFGEDRITMDKSSECYVDFSKPYVVDGVTLFGFHKWFYEQPHKQEEFTIVDVESLPIPPAAMRRPWQAGGELWQTDLRADHWDPPKSEEGEPPAETPKEDPR